jgi:hypothetical protein
MIARPTRESWASTPECTAACACSAPAIPAPSLHPPPAAPPRPALPVDTAPLPGLDLADTAAAHRRVESRGGQGKVVLRVAGEPAGRAACCTSVEVLTAAVRARFDGATVTGGRVESGEPDGRRARPAP